MKTAVHFGFFMRTIGAAMTPNGARDKKVALMELEKEYPPSDGWEITHMAYTGNPPEGWTFAFAMTQYVTDTPVVNVKSK